MNITNIKHQHFSTNKKSIFKECISTKQKLLKLEKQNIELILPLDKAKCVGKMTIQAYVVFFSLAIFAFLTPSLSHILHSTIPLQIKPRRRLENLSHPICCFKLTATPCFAFDLKKWIPWPVFQAFYTRSQVNKRYSLSHLKYSS